MGLYIPDRPTNYLTIRNTSKAEKELTVTYYGRRQQLGCGHESETESRLRIHTFTAGRAELLSLLRENKIDFVERFPPVGIIVASSETIEIIGAIASIVATLAPVLIVWLHKQKSRRIYVRTESNKSEFLMQGYSVEQAREFLSVAKSVTLVQTKPDESD